MSFSTNVNAIGLQSSGIKKALIIGINYYGSDCELGGCVNDAHNSRNMLLANGFALKDVDMMNDNKNDPDFEEPTMANIKKGIAWLVAGAKEGDLLFMHYSGHGSTIPDKLKIEKDGYAECLCPSDYEKSGMLADYELRQLLIEPLPWGVQLVVLLDCCHSGSGLDLRYNYLLDAPQTVCERLNCGQLHYINEKLTSTKCYVTMISGCKDSQTSADATIDNSRQGAMSAALWYTIKKYPKCSYSLLLEKMRKYLIKNKYDQIPQLSSGDALSLCDPFPFRL